jgi:RNA polymerase sigma-70 factor (ECF subfamily)
MVDWDELVRREGPVVWRAIFRLVGNRADADECLQETFVAAVRLSGRQAVENWPALLKRLSMARAVDCLRRRARRGRRAETADVTAMAGGAALPDAEAERAELAAALRLALAQLPARSAEAFLLHELEGWSYQEIGEHLSVSAAAVGALLHRARRKLRKLLVKVLERHS